MKKMYPFDPAPSYEDVFPASVNYSYFDGKKYATALIDQIIRICGQPPIGSYFKSKNNRENRENGQYEWISVVYHYEDTNDEHISYLGQIELKFPEYWDEKAKELIS